VLVDLCFALDCHLSDLVTLEITDVKPHLVAPCQSGAALPVAWIRSRFHPPEASE
jgi:hypothetical protein